MNRCSICGAEWSGNVHVCEQENRIKNPIDVSNVLFQHDKEAAFKEFERMAVAQTNSVQLVMKETLDNVSKLVMSIDEKNEERFKEANIVTERKAEETKKQIRVQNACILVASGKSSIKDCIDIVMLIEKEFEKYE